MTENNSDNQSSNENKQSIDKSTATLCFPDAPNLEGLNEKEKKKNKELQGKINACVNHILREIRIEVQEIARIIDQHVSGQLDITTHKEFLDITRSEVEDKLNELVNVHLKFLPPVDYYSEVINLWQIISTSSVLDTDKLKELSKDNQIMLRELTLLKNRISRLCFYIEYITGKERINHWLEKSKPGYALPLHRIFEDELVSEEDRKKIINLYSLCPKDFHGGLIDAAKGIILCHSTNGFVIFCRVLLVALVSILSFWLVTYFGKLLENSSVLRTALEIQQDNVPAASVLVLFWSALLVGVGGHILVTGAKEVNLEFRQFPLPMSDWFYYLSARTTMILYKITLALFVFLSLFVLLKGELGMLDAFLVGYSFDSVVELVGVSLEKRSANSLIAMKEKV